jgi:hypothetical protein
LQAIEQEARLQAVRDAEAAATAAAAAAAAMEAELQVQTLHSCSLGFKFFSNLYFLLKAATECVWSVVSGSICSGSIGSGSDSRSCLAGGLW